MATSVFAFADEPDLPSAAEQSLDDIVRWAGPDELLAVRAPEPALMHRSGGRTSRW